MKVSGASEKLPGGKGIKVLGIKVKFSLSETVKKIISCIKQVQST